VALDKKINCWLWRNWNSGSVSTVYKVNMWLLWCSDFCMFICSY